MRDITERKEIQRQLEESTSVSNGSRTLHPTSSESLRMISSYPILIDERYGDELEKDGREFLGFAADGAERMREMIDGLLE